MKKICCLILCIYLMFVFCSCGKKCEHNIVIDEAKTPTCTESGLTEGKYCSICNTVITAQEKLNPLGHTTTGGLCSNCNQSIGIWTIKKYVDEFKEETSKSYIDTTSRISGTFNNSATSNSKLSVAFAIEEDIFSIFLYEYGNNLVKSTSNKFYGITVKQGNYKFDVSGVMNGDRIEIYSELSIVQLKNALSSSKTVEFYIEEKDRKITNYLFSVQPSNFSVEYDKLVEINKELNKKEELYPAKPQETDETIKNQIKTQLANGSIETEYIGYAMDMDLSFLSNSDREKLNKCIADLKKLQGAFDCEDYSYFFYINKGNFYWGDSKDCYRMDATYNLTDGLWEDVSFSENIIEINSNNFTTKVGNLKVYFKYNRIDIDGLPSCYDEYIIK